MAECIRKRSEIENKYKWNLTHIYPSDEAWQADYDSLAGKVEELTALNGN